MFKVLTFLRRDFLIETSYRFAFLLRIGGIFFLLSIFYFLSQLFKGFPTLHFTPYTTEYFPFVLIGLASTCYLDFGLNVFTNYLQREMNYGTLEIQVATPTGLIVNLFLSALWPLIYTTLETIIYLLFGIIVFGARIKIENIFFSLITLITGLIPLLGVGLISASIILYFKRGDLLTWLTTNFFTFLSGVYFPVTILPQWLQNISSFIPFTFTLESLRILLLKDTTFSFKYLFSPIIFSLFLFPLSILIFDYALKKTKIKGTLGHY